MESEQCPCCKGKGRTLQAWTDNNNRVHWQAEGVCPRCYGAGYVYVESEVELHAN